MIKHDSLCLFFVHIKERATIKYKINRVYDIYIKGVDDAKISFHFGNWKVNIGPQRYLFQKLVPKGFNNFTANYVMKIIVNASTYTFRRRYYFPLEEFLI